MRIKNFTSVFICAAALSASAGAIAGEVSGSPVTASVDIVFTDPVQFSHTLTAVDGFESGTTVGATVVANGQVNFSSGATTNVAVSFGSGAYIQSNQRISVAGASDSSNKVVFAMADGNGDALAGSNVKSAQDGIPDPFSVVSVESGIAKYSIWVLSGQTVVADAYNMSVTAYAYTA